MKSLERLRHYDTTKPTVAERVADFLVRRRMEAGIIGLSALAITGSIALANEDGDLAERIEAAHLREPLDGSTCSIRTVERGETPDKLARLIAAEVDIELGNGQHYTILRPSVESMSETIGFVTREGAKDLAPLQAGEQFAVCVDPYGRRDIFTAEVVTD